MAGRGGAGAARERTKAELKRVLNADIEKLYYQSTLTWEEAARRDQENRTPDS